MYICLIKLLDFNYIYSFKLKFIKIINQLNYSENHLKLNPIKSLFFDLLIIISFLLEMR